MYKACGNCRFWNRTTPDQEWGKCRVANPFMELDIFGGSCVATRRGALCPRHLPCSSDQVGAGLDGATGGMANPVRDDAASAGGRDVAESFDNYLVKSFTPAGPGRGRGGLAEKLGAGEPAVRERVSGPATSREAAGLLGSDAPLARVRENDPPRAEFHRAESGGAASGQTDAPGSGTRTAPGAEHKDGHARARGEAFWRVTCTLRLACAPLAAEEGR
jgi:hypothetical protein